MEVFKIFKKILFTSIASLAFFAYSTNDVEATSYKYDDTDYDFTYNSWSNNLNPYATLSDNIYDVDVNMFGLDSHATYTFKSTSYVSSVKIYNNNEVRRNEVSVYKDGDLIETILPSDTGESVLIDKEVDVIKIKNAVAEMTGISEIEIFGRVPDTVPPSPITNISYVISENNSIHFNFDLPSDEDFSHVEVMLNNELYTSNLKENSLIVPELVPEESYTFSFVAVDQSGNRSTIEVVSLTMPSGPDLIAPLDITEFDYKVSDTVANFTFNLPIDSDFSHLQIYRNNTLVGEHVNIASFNDVELEPDTSYEYMFKSVDTSGNVSKGYNLTIKTMPYNDLTPPVVLDNVNVQEGNSSLFVSWTPSTETDVEGYNVYVNGVKQNAGLVNGSSYSVTNLENGTAYKVQVTAVDTNNNESEFSEIVLGTPDKNVLPVFKLDNDLSDVGMSIENWFSEIWLITAFSIGLPLAFIVGRRVKALFFA